MTSVTSFRDVDVPAVLALMLLGGHGSMWHTTDGRVLDLHSTSGPPQARCATVAAYVVAAMTRQRHWEDSLRRRPDGQSRPLYTSAYIKNPS